MKNMLVNGKWYTHADKVDYVITLKNEHNICRRMRLIPPILGGIIPIFDKNHKPRLRLFLVLKTEVQLGCNSTIHMNHLWVRTKELKPL